MVRLVKTTNWMENVQNFEVEITGYLKSYHKWTVPKLIQRMLVVTPPRTAEVSCSEENNRKKGTKRREGTTWGGWWRRFRKVCRA